MMDHKEPLYPRSLYRSLPSLFLHRVEERGQQPLFGSKQENGWKTIGYREALGQIKRLFMALRELHVQSGERLAIIAPNSPRWAMADLAILSAGGVTVPIYPNEMVSGIEKILAETQAVGLFVGGEEAREKVRQVVPHLSDLRFVIDLQGEPEKTGAVAGRAKPLREAYDALQARYARHEDFDAFFAAQEQIDPSDLATIIFTSGTSGEAKGVMLTHGQLLNNLEAALQVIPLQSGDRLLSFLPLSHSFERTCGLYAPIYAGAEVFYAPSVAEVDSALREVSPTVIIGVPRSCEKMAERIEERERRAARPLRFLFRRHLAAELQAAYNRQGDNAPYRWIAPFYRWLGRKLFWPKIAQGLGGRLRLMVIGGAALPPSLAEWINALGLCVLPGYGLTEAGPVVSVNPLQAKRLDTVGLPLPGVEVRVNPAGELLVRSPSVMSGYFQREEETRQALDSEGWLHTGDLATLDAQGYITLCGRIKDLIITSGGKNIAPQPLESALASQPLVEQVCVLGEGRPYLVALIVPSKERLCAFGREKNLGHLPYEELLQRPEVETLFQHYIEETNRRFPPYAHLRKIALLATPFSTESGELTTTLKIKRRQIEERQRALLDCLYAQ